MKNTFFSLAALLCATAAMAQSAALGSPQMIQPGFACPAGYQWSVNTPIPSCVPSVGGSAELPSRFQQSPLRRAFLRLRCAGWIDKSLSELVPG